MTLQFLADGLISGAGIAIGAIGITLAYSILRFANFAHGELVAWGTYLSVTVAAAIGGLFAATAGPLDPLSVGWNVVIGGLLAMVLTGALALAVDTLVFRRLRANGTAVTAVMASFGASMALRALLEACFTSQPRYFSGELQIAVPIGLGMRVTPDQIALLVVTVVIAGGTQWLMSRTSLGRAMRAVSEDPVLARVFGVDVDRVIRVTWLVAGALACAAGVMIGLVVQIRPAMGSEMLLPLFAAAILGGIGSIPGALVGGLLIGVLEAAAVQLVGAQWRAGVAFLVLVAVLVLRPTGLFGRPS